MAIYLSAQYESGIVRFVMLYFAVLLLHVASYFGMRAENHVHIM